MPVPRIVPNACLTLVVGAGIAVGITLACSECRPGSDRGTATMSVEDATAVVSLFHDPTRWPFDAHERVRLVSEQEQQLGFDSQACAGRWVRAGTSRQGWGWSESDIHERFLISPHCVGDIGSSLATLSDYLTVETYGWPWPVWSRLHEPEPYVDPYYRFNTWNITCTRVHGTGALANSILFGAVAWIATMLPVQVRRSSRKRHGVCVRCAYDLRGESEQGCPECGWRRSQSISVNPGS